MNWGAFAGGAAKGISNGADAMNKITRTRAIRQAIEDEEQWKKDRAAVETESTQVKNANAPASAAYQDAAGVGQAQPADAYQASTGDGPVTSATQEAIASTGVQQKKPQQISLADSIDLATKYALVDMKHGKGDGTNIVRLQSLSKKLQSEDLDSAVGLMHAGMFKQGLDHYNSQGEDNGYEFVGNPTETETDILGHKIPTVLAKVRDKNGNETTIDTAKYMFSRMGMDDTLKAMEQNARTGIMRDRANKVGAGGGGRGGGKSNYGKTFRDIQEAHPDWDENQIDEYITQNGLVGRKPGAGKSTDITPNAKAKLEVELADAEGPDASFVTEHNAAKINTMRKQVGKPPLVAETTPGEPKSKLLGVAVPFTGTESKTKYVESKSDASAIRDTTGSKPVSDLPQDKSKRVKGSEYKGPDGNLYFWDGQGLLRK
jgi:hypothetical protein